MLPFPVRGVLVTKKHNDSPVDVLISFLFRYTQSTPSCLTTNINRDVILHSSNGNGEADLSGVYRIKECVEVFKMAYNAMHDNTEKTKRDKCPGGFTTFIGQMIDVKMLMAERENFSKQSEISALVGSPRLLD